MIGLTGYKGDLEMYNEKKNKNPAFVFNCHYNGLSIIQDLGRQGVNVYALDNNCSVGALSRYAQFRKVPDPARNEEGFIYTLRSLCTQQEQKPVLFPTNDHWAAALSRHRDYLQDISFPVVSSWAAVRTVLDKKEFFQLGSERGYLTPKTWEPSLINEIPDNEFPLVVKPRWRRMSSGFGPQHNHALLDRLRLIPIADRAMGVNILKRLSGLEEHLILQTFVPGNCDQMHTVGVYANTQSEIKSLFIGRKVRGYPVAYGDMAVGETSSVPQNLIKLVKRCVEEIRLEGILEFEFKYDISRKRFWLIEINPRSWAWVLATSFCGHSLCWIAYIDQIGHSLEQINLESKYGHGEFRYVFVHKDLPRVLFYNHKDEPAWSMGWRQWLEDHKKAKKVTWADLQLDDPLPTLYSIWLTIRRILAGIYRKLSAILNLKVKIC